MLAGRPPVDPVLARDYPRGLRDAYRSALRRDSVAERHHQLLRLGEVSLAYLASLAFADYRRTFAAEPNLRIEEFIASIKRFTMGQYLALFRLTQRALGRAEIFGLKRHEVNVRLEHAQRWVSAVRSIEYAQKVGATDILRVVEEGLQHATKRVRWLTFWDELVNYRNQVAHADANDWPIDAGGYFEAMTPLLEAALVDALRTEYIDHVFLEYPTAELLDARRARDGWVLRFDGEYHGVPLLAEVVRDLPPEGWESEVGGRYVLQMSATGWSPHSRFYDLSHDVPEPHSREREPQASSATVLARRESNLDEWATPGAKSGSRPADDATEREGETPPRAIRASTHEPDVAPADAESPGLGSVETSRHRGASDRAKQVLDSSHRESASGSGASTASSDESEGWYPTFSPWMLWGILSLGLLAGVGFLVASARVGDRRLRTAAIAYGAIAVVVLVVAGIAGDSDDHPVLDAIGATLLFATWFVSTVHAFAVNPRVRRQRRARG